MTQADAPPQGPGVHVPFPAPPTEGRRLRVGMGLGIGGAVLVLVCGGGLAAVIGLTSVMTSAFNEQADVVVGNYLEDLEAKRYAEAYDSLCADERAALTESEFTSRVQAQQPITDWNVGDVDLTTLGAPVDVTYADGRTAQLRASLGQNPETGGFELCSLGE